VVAPFTPDADIPPLGILEPGISYSVTAVFDSPAIQIRSDFAEILGTFDTDVQGD